MKTIAWVFDERLSKERAKRLTSLIQRVKAANATVDVIAGDTPEAALVEQLHSKPYTAVFLPAHRTLASAKWDVVFGVANKSAAPVVGYHCEGLPARDLAAAEGRSKLLLLDLSSGGDEVLKLILALAQDTARTGILPLLDAGTTVHATNWGPIQAMGALLDEIPNLSEVARTDWSRRTPAIRSALTALWSLVYEHGAGKNSATLQGAAADVFRAQLQFAVDAQTLVLRLITPVPSSQHIEFLHAFWPGARSQFHPAQILMRDCDFVRAYHWQDRGLTEVTVGLLGTQSIEHSTDGVRTLLLDSVPEKSIVEQPFDMNALSGNVKRLGASSGAPGVAGLAKDAALLPSVAKRFLSEASAKIRQLRTIIADKDSIIQELRSGGVGTAPVLPPMEPEDLLESFQERYFQAKLQIRQFEVAIEKLMNKPGATQQEVEAVKLKMDQLIQRQEAWIRAIHRIVVEQGKERKKAGQ